MALVARTERQRAELTGRIRALKEQRDDYLASEVESTEAKEHSLDYRLFDTVREQAQKKGLEYAAGPSL